MRPVASHDNDVAAMNMEPSCGEQTVCYVGDTVRFTLNGVPSGDHAFLRTNIGRGGAIRGEIIRAIQEPEVQVDKSWRDIPMRPIDDRWELQLALAEVGWFQAKCYVMDDAGRQHWPEGDNASISVHPNFCRAANVIYCAFPRMFGPNMRAACTEHLSEDDRINSLDTEGYAVIPPSGTFRDLKNQLPHVFENLGCKILHLLPVNPTPTTFARMGRFGSPYACGDLTAIDPALVEFDKRTTGVEQFCELADAVHGYGGRVFLDLVINHTGWGSTLQNDHPEWFLREENGDFASPGAWGVTWGDLVELDPDHRGLWEHIAEAFIIWCERGVDGFRCDAGYKVPMPVWRYVIARVREQYPDTVFLLEGLGGGWEQTESLLTQGGMQWAYSELFQEYSGHDVASYLDHAVKQSSRVGTLIHYSETHDNERLAAKGRSWSLMRNQLCALTSVNGGFAFTNGVEWLAQERINVHSARGLNWGCSDNIVNELAMLNRLISTHPAFFDRAVMDRLSSPEETVLVLKRTTKGLNDEVYVMVNTSMEHAVGVGVPQGQWHDALTGDWIEVSADGLNLGPAEVRCLMVDEREADTGYLKRRSRAAWAVQCIAELYEAEKFGDLDWEFLDQSVNQSPERFLAGLMELNQGPLSKESLKCCLSDGFFPQVSVWTIEDVQRVFPFPNGHWLMIRAASPFRVSLAGRHIESIETDSGHIGAFPPFLGKGTKELSFRCSQEDAPEIRGCIYVGGHESTNQPFSVRTSRQAGENGLKQTALLTNGRGAMSRIPIDLEGVQSKYDCVLGANLHAAAPVDRHVLVKRIRLWAVADGFISPLDSTNLLAFEQGPVAQWHFLVNAGDGRSVDVYLKAEMPPGKNGIVFTLSRGSSAPSSGQPLEAEKSFSVTVRLDLEDRSFHQETDLSMESEAGFESATQSRPDGFTFAPAVDRRLDVQVDTGCFHPEVEWCRGVNHPLEATRGQKAQGDAFSPGWFDIPLGSGGLAKMVIDAEQDKPPAWKDSALCTPQDCEFEGRLTAALEQFLVKRDQGQTVIAGYPWFLDWGRDTFIVVRGMLSAGWVEPAREIVHTFARLEKSGTLPNALHGDNDSNRETSDAPLWFALAAEELGPDETEDDVGVGRLLKDVLISIGQHYRNGTPNGVKMDPQSGLIWSPSHFTWMDTNYPAGTPREGFPIEIQALWIRLLLHLERLDPSGDWGRLAGQAKESMIQLYTGPEQNWMGDLLVAPAGGGAHEAVLDGALRCNALLPISLGLIEGPVAQATVKAAQRFLLVPGAIRTLAPLRVQTPHAIIGHHGEALNDPFNPYWGQYEGDEDTRRKPAYHNGTAWVWPLGIFCEALVKAWGGSKASVSAAKSYLLMTEPMLNQGCLGHLPEIMDGDAPHTHRGCDAQAWSVSEVLRVWKWLNEHEYKQ